MTFPYSPELAQEFVYIEKKTPLRLSVNSERNIMIGQRNTSVIKYFKSFLVNL